MPTYPYAQPIGALTAILDQFRKIFPTSVTAATLQSLGIAPKNESYVVNTLRFLGLLDADGNKQDTAAAAFLVYDDDEYRTTLGELVKGAYGALFSLHGDAAWNLDSGKLITFFRQADKTTELVGKRQASTFVRLAEICGARSVPDSPPPSAASKPASGKKPRPAPRPAPGAPQPTADLTSAASLASPLVSAGQAPLTLAVRIELNLPATDDQKVYDSLFRSIREHFLDSGKS